MRRTRAHWPVPPCGVDPRYPRNARGLPSNSIRESTGSTVVPATSCTTERSSPVRRFNSELLPTFGLPTRATRRGPPVPEPSSETSGRTASTASSRSATPRPCIALTGWGSPSPNDHSNAASDSIFSLSTLLAAKKTGLPERCNRLAAASSALVAPVTESTTRMMASAVRIATEACSATRLCRPFASGSQPPVSCTMNRRPSQAAS